MGNLVSPLILPGHSSTGKLIPMSAAESCTRKRAALHGNVPADTVVELNRRRKSPISAGNCVSEIVAEVECYFWLENQREDIKYRWIEKEKRGKY